MVALKMIAIILVASSLLVNARLSTMEVSSSSEEGLSEGMQHQSKGHYKVIRVVR